MAFHIVQEIRKRSREEWGSMLTSRWNNIRIWIQENGELACIAGVFFGFVGVLFFKYVIGILAVAFILGFIVYQMAYPESDMPAQPVSPAVEATAEPVVSTNGSSSTAPKDPEDKASPKT